MGATAMSIIAIAGAINFASPDTSAPAPVAITQVTQVAQTDNLTNVSMMHAKASEANPVGSVREVSYEGKVVGQIKQTATGREVKSNLSPEDTVRIFKELKDAGKADNIAIKDDAAVTSSSYKNIVDNIGGAKKSYVTDIETVVLATSVSFRTGTSLEQNSPEAVAKNIQKIRESMTYQKTNKLTMG